MATMTNSRTTTNGRHFKPPVSATTTATKKTEYLMPELGQPWPFPISYLPNGWGMSIAKVTPDLAERMLRTNVENQRRIIKTAVHRYAQDMSSDSWKLTHQGIAFNEYGQLHDGQNRLSAIVDSGCTVPMLVFFGAGSQAEMTVIDTTKARTVYDAAAVNGIEVNARVAVPLWMAVRYGDGGGGGMKLSQLALTTRLKYLNRYQTRLLDIARWFGTSLMAQRIGRSAFRAAVFCAYPHVNHKCLERFAAVLTEQLNPHPGEGVCKQLRAIGLTQKRSNLDHEHFLKTCRAIELFHAKQEVARLYACEENPFPFDINSEN